MRCHLSRVFKGVLEIRFIINFNLEQWYSVSISWPTCTNIRMYVSLGLQNSENSATEITTIYFTENLNYPFFQLSQYFLIHEKYNMHQFWLQIENLIPCIFKLFKCTLYRPFISLCMPKVKDIRVMMKGCIKQKQKFILFKQKSITECTFAVTST